MPDRRDARCDEGQTSSEFLGMLVIVAVLLTGLAATPIGSRVTAGIEAAICRILGGGCTTGPGPEAITHVPEQCTTLSSSRNANASITVFSVKLDGGVTLTVNRSVDRDGAEKWTVDEVHDGGIGLAVQTPGGGVSINGKGAKLEAQASASLTGAGGYTYRFGSEAEARDFLTTATHQIVEDTVASSNPVTRWGFGRDAAMWVMDRADGRTYDPPAPTESWAEGGLKIDASTATSARALGGGVQGGAAVMIGARTNHDGDRTTYFFKVTREVAGNVGLIGVGSGELATDGEVVVGIEFHNASGEPTEASISANGTLSGGLSSPLAAEGSTLSTILDDATLSQTEGKHGTADLTLDLNLPRNRQAFADAAGSLGVPMLSAYASPDRVGPVDAVRGLYDLYDQGAPGTYLGVVTYDRGDTGFDASASGGAGVRFAGGLGFGTTDQNVDSAWYYDPDQGAMVPWLQCSM